MSGSGDIKDKVNNLTKETGKLINIQFLLSVILYLVFLVLFYFKGLHGDGSGLTIFITIILYVYNIIWFFNHNFNLNIKKSLIQIGLFYLLNLFLIFVYFDPFTKTKQIDPSMASATYNDYKPLIFGFIAIAGLISLIIFAFVNLSQKSGVYKSSASIYSSTWFLESFFSVLGVVLFIFGLISISIYLFLYTSWPITIVASILNICILIITLALIYKAIDKPKVNTSSFFDLMTSYIFYIPCLFIQLVDYIKHQHKITSKTVWIIFLLEIFLIGMRILLPIYNKIYNKYLGAHGKTIEKGPVYLDKKSNLGTFQDHQIEIDDTGTTITKKPYNYNYAISAWIWINPQPESINPSYVNSTNLLNYGDVLQIKFYKNKLEMWALTTENPDSAKNLVKIYETTEFYYQKWNNILLNYSGGTLDIFINNKLVSSTINVTPIMKRECVIAGSSNGIHGGIKDVVYYKNILTNNQINALYNSE